MEGEQGLNFNTKLLKSIRNSFKPSLFARMLYEGGGLKALSQTGGGPPIVAGIDPVDVLAASPSYIRFFFARSIVFVFMVVIAYWAALKTATVPAIQSGVMGSVDVNSDETSGHKKWLRLMLLLLVYLLFFVLWMKVVMLVPWGAMYMYYSSLGTIKDVYAHTEAAFQSVFHVFTSNSGPGNMAVFDSFLAYSVWGVLIMFLLYTLFVKSFFKGISYPEYHENDKEEPKTEKKFLLFHTLTSIFILLFMIGIYCAHHSFSSTEDMVWLVYMYFMIGAVALLIQLMIRYELKRSIFMFLILGFLLLGLVMVNSSILEGN